MQIDRDLPIGVFDSGVGGISVLAELIISLPNEKYIYYGDSKNAPYGVRTTEEVKKLAFNVVEILLKKKIKGLVAACNTATSGAIEDLRKSFNIPIVGVEPALKPAVALNKPGEILVLATPVTLREKKFNRLIESINTQHQIIKLPCPGLPELIEETGGAGKEIGDYLKNIFSPLDMDKIGIIVLGCTHYIFIRDEITKLIGPSIDIIDGNRGAAKQLKRLLARHKLLSKNNNTNETEILFLNSNANEHTLNLSKRLLDKQLRYLGWQGKLTYS